MCCCRHSALLAAPHRAAALLRPMATRRRALRAAKAAQRLECRVALRLTVCCCRHSALLAAPHRAAALLRPMATRRRALRAANGAQRLECGVAQRLTVCCCRHSALLPPQRAARRAAPRRRAAATDGDQGQGGASRVMHVCVLCDQARVCVCFLSFCSSAPLSRHGQLGGVCAAATDGDSRRAIRAAKAALQVRWC